MFGTSGRTTTRFFSPRAFSGTTVVITRRAAGLAGSFFRHPAKASAQARMAAVPRIARLSFVMGRSLSCDL